MSEDKKPWFRVVTTGVVVTVAAVTVESLLGETVWGWIIAGVLLLIIIVVFLPWVDTGLWPWQLFEVEENEERDQARLALAKIEEILRTVYDEFGPTGTEEQLDEAIGHVFLVLGDEKLGRWTER